MPKERGTSPTSETQAEINVFDIANQIKPNRVSFSKYIETTFNLKFFLKNENVLCFREKIQCNQWRTQTFWFGGAQHKKGKQTLGGSGAEPPDAGEILKIYPKFFM